MCRSTWLEQHLNTTPQTLLNLPIIAVAWNTEGRICHISPQKRLAYKLAKEILEAKWGINSVHIDPCCPSAQSAGDKPGLN